MSTVVNSSELTTLFGQLGWTTSVTELTQAAFASNIPASIVVLYLQALLGAPAGLNDQAIAGVTPAQGTAITGFLRNKGLVGV